MTTPSADRRIAEAILELAEARGTGTFCPSEVARRMSEDWRPLMDDVRRVAAGLVRDGRLRASQAGRTVAIETARGPIRLGAPR